MVGSEAETTYMKIDHHQTICFKHNIPPFGGGDVSVLEED